MTKRKNSGKKALQKLFDGLVKEFGLVEGGLSFKFGIGTGRYWLVERQRWSRVHLLMKWDNGDVWVDDDFFGGIIKLSPAMMSRWEDDQINQLGRLIVKTVYERHPELQRSA